MSIDRAIKIDGCLDEYQHGKASAELSGDGLARCEHDGAPFKASSWLKSTFHFRGKLLFSHICASLKVTTELPAQ